MTLASAIGATTIRAKLLKAFEIAEIEVDPSQHRDLLTFVLVGAGPTGVEMAGAIVDMLRGTLRPTSDGLTRARPASFWSRALPGFCPPSPNRCRRKPMPGSSRWA